MPLNQRVADVAATKRDSLCVPRPVPLGRRTIWRVAELEEWVNAGCPARERWEADLDGVWRAKPGLGGNRPFVPGSGKNRR